MTNYELPTTSKKRRRPLLTFSLRFLLLAVTAFAIGFPIWYRWPYEVSDTKRSQNPDVRHTTTWQREWGGGRTKVAQSRYYKGKRDLFQGFRGEMRHGPFEVATYAGTFREVGRYTGGKKDGRWQRFDSQGKVTEAIPWSLGLLDGEFTRVEGDGRARKWTFAKGRLLSVDGATAESYWPAVAAEKRSVPAELKVALDKKVVPSFPPNFQVTPLKDVVDFLAASHETPVRIDRHHVDETRPITIDCSGTDLYSSLTMIAHEYGMACDVRYGCVWIASPESALHWKDSTGVEALIPPGGSKLSKAWNSDASMMVNGDPFFDVIERLAELLAVDIDTTAVAPHAKEDSDRFNVIISTLTLLRYKDVLGLLLDEAHCRCELRGETLVILPAE
jgi:hypothetical protein